MSQASFYWKHIHVGLDLLIPDENERNRLEDFLEDFERYSCGQDKDGNELDWDIHSDSNHPEHVKCWRNNEVFIIYGKSQVSRNQIQRVFQTTLDEYRIFDYHKWRTDRPFTGQLMFIGCYSNETVEEYYKYLRRVLSRPNGVNMNVCYLTDVLPPDDICDKSVIINVHEILDEYDKVVGRISAKLFPELEETIGGYLYPEPLCNSERNEWPRNQFPWKEFNLKWSVKLCGCENEYCRGCEKWMM